MYQRKSIVQRRKYEGVACQWNTSITHNVKPFKCDSKRICGLVIALSNGKILFSVNTTVAM